MILGVPIVDTAFSFVRRVVRHQHFADADTRASAPSPDAHGSRASAGGRDPVALDGAVVGCGAAADVHAPRATRWSCRRSWPSACSSTSTSIRACGAAGTRSRRPSRNPLTHSRTHRPVYRPVHPPIRWSSSTGTAGSGLAAEAAGQLEHTRRQPPSSCTSGDASGSLRKDSQAPRTQRRARGEWRARGGNSRRVGEREERLRRRPHPGPHTGRRLRCSSASWAPSSIVCSAPGPVFLLVLGFVGVLGACITAYYEYEARIARHDEGKPWARQKR